MVGLPLAPPAPAPPPASSAMILDHHDDDNDDEEQVPSAACIFGHKTTMETKEQGGEEEEEEEESSSESDVGSLQDNAVHFHEPKVTSSSKSYAGWIISHVKTFVSGALLVFCLVLLMTAMFTHQTRATSPAYQWHPVEACVLFWIVMAWLAVIEGGLNCQVGLRHLPTLWYQSTHPLAFRATQLCAQRPHNLERFIVGRQYMDLSMVFCISFLATTVENVQVLGLPTAVTTLFLNSGLAMTIVTIVLGQLALQINAANCMLDYMNTYTMLGSTYLALAVEASGICHVVYLVQRVVASSHQKKKKKKKKQSTTAAAVAAQEEEHVAGLESGTTTITTHKACEKATTADSSLSKKTTPLWQSIAFWLRVAVSAALLVFALTTVVLATVRQQTKMFVGVPPWASLLLLVALIVFVGIMDALQIALMAVVHIPQEELEHKPTALANAKYVIGGHRLQSFLLGRQIGQTMVQFLLARITTLNVPLGQGENMWGVSDTMQKLFNMGILGAIIATILASLIWRVLASEYPLAFLSLPVSKPIIVLCLWAEQTGIINISWTLAALHRKIARVKPDEYYLGNTEYYRQRHPRPHGSSAAKEESTSSTLESSLPEHVDVETPQTADTSSSLQTTIGASPEDDTESSV